MSCDQASACVHGGTSESSKCDFVLLELLTLVASRNTSLLADHRLIKHNHWNETGFRSIGDSCFDCEGVMA